MALIDAKNLTKTYQMGPNELQALKGVSLTIDAGEFIAITGYSGSGKSTLMHVLGCLDKPSQGSYLLDGIDVMQADKDELAHIRNQKIGFVFQKFHLLPDLTAQDNVTLPALYAGQNETDARAQAAQLLQTVGLGERIDHYPYQLSGGQQQRVAIARALMNKPSIIFADEPTGNLDTETGDKIMELLTTLNQEQKATIIIVTHEPNIAAKTRRIIELVNGNIVKDSDTSQQVNTPS